jgi:sulfotransferase
MQHAPERGRVACGHHCQAEIDYGTMTQYLMEKTYYFITGLPRSGSTLLEAILRQNPRFYARMSSPLGDLYSALLQDMSEKNRFSLFLTDAKRKRLLKGLVESYYSDTDKEVIFDTHRGWSNKISSLVDLFPKTKLICCVRDIPWILDSFERLTQREPHRISRMFGFNPDWTVYDRVVYLMQPNGSVGYPLNALRQAYSGEHAERLLLIPYESLARFPERTIEGLYKFLDEEAYPHDFGNIQYSEPEFDNNIGMPGMHTVSSPIRFQERKSILPPDIVERYKNLSFWET